MLFLLDALAGFSRAWTPKSPAEAGWGGHAHSFFSGWTARCAVVGLIAAGIVDIVAGMAIQLSQPGTLVIRGGRVVDPSSGVDRVGDVVVIDGRIALGGESVPAGAVSIDAGGLIVCPGLIDIHVHLREPGGEHKETIETGSRAAAAGGFTGGACMPNTAPAIDNAETLDFVRRRAREAGLCRVYPIAAITMGRKGSQLVNMATLRERGAVAFSDDGDGVEDDGVMRAALERAKPLGVPLIQHCEFKSMSAGGVMHKGAVSDQLGLPGIDVVAEEAMIERDIELVRTTGGRYHVAHISTVGAVDLVRRAKADGLPVTAEVCTHHLVLTDEACSGRDPNTKMHPPLRSRSDVDACIEGLRDGTIDCIVTDHAPHAAEEKDRGFVDAPFGIVGLETALTLAAEALVTSGIWGWAELIQRMTSTPARLLGLPGGSLAAEREADITIIDPDVTWRIAASSMCSKSANTPFDGRKVVGRPIATILGGRLTYHASDEADRFSVIAAGSHRASG